MSFRFKLLICINSALYITITSEIVRRTVETVDKIRGVISVYFFVRLGILVTIATGYGAQQLNGAVEMEISGHMTPSAKLEKIKREIETYQGSLNSSHASMLPLYTRATKIITVLHIIKLFSGYFPVIEISLLFQHALQYLKNVEHRLEPGETPSYSASHQAPNYVQCFLNIPKHF